MGEEQFSNNHEQPTNVVNNDIDECFDVIPVLSDQCLVAQSKVLSNKRNQARTKGKTKKQNVIT